MDYIRICQQTTDNSQQSLFNVLFILEDEGLTPKKLMWYLICGAIGLAIGFLFVALKNN